MSKSLEKVNKRAMCILGKNFQSERSATNMDHNVRRQLEVLRNSKDDSVTGVKGERGRT